MSQSRCTFLNNLFVSFINQVAQQVMPTQNEEKISSFGFFTSHRVKSRKITLNHSPYSTPLPLLSSNIQTIVNENQVSEQEKICRYLEIIAQKNMDEKKAEKSLHNQKPENEFIICDEVKHDSSGHNRYFRMYFFDTRMDKHFFQITPSAVLKEGVLQINDKGELSILDMHHFEPDDVNVKFLFNNNKLEMDITWKQVEQQSNSCVIC